MSAFQPMETIPVYTKLYDFIFTIARMNPPTPGHKELVKQMMEEAYKYGIPVYIGLSSTCCKEDNPLTCNEKKELVEAMIAQIKSENVDIKDVNTYVICSADEIGSRMMYDVTTKIITDYINNNNNNNLKFYLNNNKEINRLDYIIKRNNDEALITEKNRIMSVLKPYLPIGVMFYGDDYAGCANSQGITECIIEDPDINYSKLLPNFKNLYFAPPLVRKTDSNAPLTISGGIKIPLPIAGMSATFIRNLTLDDEDEFKKKIEKHYIDTDLDILRIKDTDLDILRINQKEIFNTIMSKSISGIDNRIISNGKTLFGLIQERYTQAKAEAKAEAASKKSKKTAPSKKTQPGAKKPAPSKAKEALEASKIAKALKAKGVGGKKPRVTKRHLKKTSKRKTRVRSRK